MKNIYLTITAFSLFFLNLNVFAQLAVTGSGTFTEGTDFTCGDNFTVEYNAGEDSYTFQICPNSADEFVDLNIDYGVLNTSPGGTGSDDNISISVVGGTFDIDGNGGGTLATGELFNNFVSPFDPNSGNDVSISYSFDPSLAGACLSITIFDDHTGGGQTDMVGNSFFSGIISCNAAGDSPNDEPCSSLPMSGFSSCNYITVDNVFSTQSAIVDPSCGGGSLYTEWDVWYNIVVPADGMFDLTFSPGSITDAAAALYSSSDGTCAGTFTEISCDDDSGAGLMPAISVTGQTPGDTLWVRLWDYGGNQYGTFDVCATVNTVPDCSNPTTNDCQGSMPLCDNSAVSDLASGQGCVADLNSSNDGCLAGEHNTSWFYIQIDDPGTGTWGFDGVFDVSSNGIEYDWALWEVTGDPTVTSTPCSNLISPIRCSYASQTGKSEVAMGMNATDADLTEGSSPSGNGYTYWLDDVATGDIYVLMVDRYSTAGGAFTINFTGSATMDCSITLPEVLPVEFVSFTGEALLERNILNWNTGSETNNDFFTVQKSKDGSFWMTAGYMDGAGTSSTENSYRFVDNGDVDGLYYYRIKQTDHDGVEKVSSVISLKNNFGDPFGQFFPNPTKSEFSFDYNGESTNAVLNVTIIDNAGRQVISDDLRVQLTNTIDVSPLNVGVYTVVLESNEGKFFRKLVRD